MLSLSIGKICDKDRNELLPNSPPPPPDSGPQCSSDDWSPYKLCIQFELADFLYCCNQMSEGDADFLFNLMNAMLASHGDCAPFCNHSNMHNTIDATTFGEEPWDHFTLNYTGPLPEGISRENVPGWMTEDHEVWFHDPVTLLENLLANPNFKDKFDYMPYQEYAADGSHQFCDLMLGDWCWQEAVLVLFIQSVSFSLVRFYNCSEYHYQKHPEAISSFLVSTILGSNKTTISVASGHTCYRPLYLSIGNIHNNVCCGHQNGVILLGFLAIPKSKVFIINLALNILTLLP